MVKIHSHECKHSCKCSKPRDRICFGCRLEASVKYSTRTKTLWTEIVNEMIEAGKAT